ncbi:hypothetical protein FA15DRAFT_757212 [Coprinopsis marcescibilis]|uniref:Uncharacterized protein n=1 Tax=Coprinopsis marcescibilis TaxID=230819 RepID=A0A5C3KSJ4_COPMA|nr:hypothetical protein FA15DRAFT_757212 [Coprinopsis marcescibilis]
MSCRSTPTLTSTLERVVQSVFEVTLTRESTLPGATSTRTVLVETCSTVNASAVPPETACSETESLSTTTLPGVVTEVTITTESSTPVTSFLTTTLFGFDCPPDVPEPSPDPEPSPSPSPSPETSDPLPNPSGSSIQRPGISQSSGGPRGTPTLPATDNAGSGTNVAPIVGGAIGGFVGLIAIVALIWFLIKRNSNKRFDGLFDQDELHTVPKPEKHGHGYDPVGPDSVKPRPIAGLDVPSHHYQDAMVYQGGNFQETGYHGGQYQDTGYQGQGQYQDFAPQTGQDGFTNNTYQPTNDMGGYPPDAHHVRNPSVGPLVAGVAAVATGASLHAAAASSSHLSTTSGRPSTGGSMSPLIQHPPPQSHQPQGYPPPGQQPLTNFAPNNGPGYPYNPGQAPPPQGYSYPPSNLSHNLSVGTYSSGPAVSSAHGGYGAYGGMAVGGAATGLAGGYSGHGHERDESVSSIGRTGSPVSISNAHVLQVMNPEGLFAANNAGGSSSGGVSAAAAAPLVDGKGRQINTKGEKQPIVHLDGGRYEETAQTVGTTQPVAGPAPPAYTN